MVANHRYFGWARLCRQSILETQRLCWYRLLCHRLLRHVGQYDADDEHHFSLNHARNSLGIPTGILMAQSKKARAIITPILDIMQTMPAFVYLIPVVMLLGIGKIPGVIAVVIYAIPPVIRLTDLGIRLVDKEVLEAATAYGASPAQRLFGVQVPLAMPNIMAGINQTIMMALAMVVIASMIGVKGLGQPVLKSITNQYFTLGLLNGLAIVALAIIFDRVSQSYAKRTQAHLGGRE